VRGGVAGFSVPRDERGSAAFAVVAPDGSVVADAAAFLEHLSVCDRSAHTQRASVRVFFTDLCSWATEPGSPLAGHAPPAIPLTHHDLRGVGFEKVRRRVAARMTATILELEREIPNIRAHAFTVWPQAADTYIAQPDDARVEPVKER
jgi:hypothetical protein